jgi:hypothetical protein
MAHVIDIHGLDFITMGRTQSSVALTADERAELTRISEDAEFEAVQARSGPGGRPMTEL